MSLHARVGSGQAACLLPSLDVVATSYAPSVELNPDSPIPSTTMVGLSRTIDSLPDNVRDYKSRSGFFIQTQKNPPF